MKFHLLALATLAITSASGGVYARASNDKEHEPSTSTKSKSSLRGMLLNEDEASTSTRRLKGGDDANAYTLERFRGVITGYQNREFVRALQPETDDWISIGSVTTGDLYKVSDFRDDEDGNPVIPSDEDKFGTFIIDVAPTKPYFDKEGNPMPGADFNFATALITLCEDTILFGGCTTFTHGGDFEVPSVKEGGSGIPGFPLMLNDVSYLGSGSSGVGASGFGIVNRKGYVKAWYTANESNELNPLNSILTGLEYAVAYNQGSGVEQVVTDLIKNSTIEDKAGFAAYVASLGFGDGKVLRQVRDFEMYSYKLTRSDLDEFLDLASVFPEILPAEAKIGGKSGSYPEVPQGRDREQVIDVYLNHRYGLKPNLDLGGFGPYTSIGYDTETIQVNNRMGQAESSRLPIHVFYPAEENPTVPDDNAYVLSALESFNMLLPYSASPDLLWLEDPIAAGCVTDINVPFKPTGSDVTVTRGAAPARGERPMIIFSHGESLSPILHTGLLLKLASWGYVVVAPVFNDYDLYQPYISARISLCNRAREVREVIKFMTAKDNAEKYGIDSSKVVAIGHSLGGATALSTVLGGSFENLDGCDFDDGLDLNLSEPDDQVDLAITLAQTTVAPTATGLKRAFTSEQVSEQLKVPVLTLSIKNDDKSQPAVHVNDIFKEMKCKEEESVRIEIEDGDHSGTFTDIYEGLDLDVVDETIGSGVSGACGDHLNQVGAYWKYTTFGIVRPVTTEERIITIANTVSFLKRFLLGKEEYEENLERDNAYEPEYLDLDASVFVDDREICDGDTLFE